LLAGAPLPAPLALPLFDVDLLLAEGAAPDATPATAGAAGTLAIDLVRPDDRLAGMGEFAAGAFGSRRWNGRIDVSLTRGIRVGLAGLVHHDLGWLANSTTGEMLNRGQRTGLAGLIDVDLTPRLAWQISLVHAGSRAGNLPGFTCDPTAQGRCGGRFASTGQRAAVASDGGPLDAGWGAIGADLAG
ncbi:hypothetical protein, partial [Sandarakinorhabdus rubra]|uniref:hypothetical protein n=1 Tax=Sandarakinorhabdus rubra TaxID=2672568 RepID=UPI0013DA011A